MTESQAAVSSVNPASVNPRSFQATVDEGTDAVAVQTDLGDLTELNLSPNLISMTEQIMGILENPTAGSIGSLQALADSAGIKPPGIGLPSIPSPIVGALPVALKVSSGGGFDIGSALSAADSLLKQPSLSAVETMLPDVGIDAPTDLTGEIPGGLSQQGVSGGLTNPFKAYGNIQFKNDFDIDGNPIKVPIDLGLPAVVPRAAVRSEPPSARPPYAPKPENTSHMQGNSSKQPGIHQTGVVYDDDGNPADPRVALWMDGVLKRGGVTEGIGQDQALGEAFPDDAGQPDTRGILPAHTKMIPNDASQVTVVDDNLFMKQIKDSGSFAGGIFNLENVNGETDVAGMIQGVDITTLPQSGIPASEDAKNLRSRGDQPPIYTNKAKKGAQGAGNVRPEDNVIVSGPRGGVGDTGTATPEQAENLEKLKNSVFPNFTAENLTPPAGSG